jgi:hypothetical protein
MTQVSARGTKQRAGAKMRAKGSSCFCAKLYSDQQGDVKKNAEPMHSGLREREVNKARTNDDQVLKLRREMSKLSP